MNINLTRRNLFIFFGITCTLLLASCGGGGGQTASIVDLHPTASNNIPLVTGSGPNGNLTPANLYPHYSVPLTSGVPTYSAGQTIAVVDAPGTNSIATIVSDLNLFTLNYGPKSSSCATPVVSGNSTTYTCNGFTFKVINLNTVPANQNSGWNAEIALDVQWSHALAPNANLILVQAQSASSADLATAVDTAASQSGVVAVSMSFGSPESSAETSLTYSPNLLNDGLFSHWTAQGTVFLASAGDSGNIRSYPAASPYVTSVGGTAIGNLSTLIPTQSPPSASPSQTSYEFAWSYDVGFQVAGTGGGASLYESMPSFQTNFASTSLAGSLGLNSVGSNSVRAIPDVAYNASSNLSPVTIVVNGAASGTGGTSAGAPQWAGIVAQMSDYYSRLSSPSPTTLKLKLANTTSYPYGFNSYLYSSYTSINSSAPFFDITVGTDITGTNPNSGTYGVGGFSCTGLCTAGVGYDDVTGLGVPVVGNLLSTLSASGGTTPSAAASPTSFNFGTVTVGSSPQTTITVTNNGTANLTFQFAPSVSGNSYSAVSTTCGTTLAVGASCSQTVKFSPSGNLTYTGSVSFLFNELPSSTYATLSGVGTGGLTPSAAASPTSFNFGTVTVGSSPQTTITVTNNGTANLTFQFAPSVSGNSYSAVSTTCGTTLAVGASCSQTVKFSPSGNLTYTGSVSFLFNELPSSTYATLSGVGTGGLTPSAAASPTSFNFGTVTVGSSPQTTITVTNNGTANLTFQFAPSVSGNSYSAVSTTCGTTLAVGASCSQTVKFSPSGNLTYTGSVSFLFNELPSSTYATLSGVGH